MEVVCMVVIHFLVFSPCLTHFLEALTLELEAAGCHVYGELHIILSRIWCWVACSCLHASYLFKDRLVTEKQWEDSYPLPRPNATLFCVFGLLIKVDFFFLYVAFGSCNNFYHGEHGLLSQKFVEVSDFLTILKGSHKYWIFKVLCNKIFIWECILG